LRSQTDNMLWFLKVKNFVTEIKQYVLGYIKNIVHYFN